MSQAETLALVATAVDNASGPLRQVKKSLDDLAKASDLGAHSKEIEKFRKELANIGGSTEHLRRGVTHVEGFKKHFEQLGEKAKESGEIIKRSFEPVLATLGITTLSVGGAITAAGFAVDKFVKSGRSLGELSNTSGFSPKFLQGWKGAAEVFRVESDKIDGIAQTVGNSLLNLGRTIDGGQLNKARILAPDFAATVGKMKEAMKDTSVPLAQQESNALKILLDRIHELHEAGETPIAIRAKLEKIGLPPELEQFSEHGGAGFLKEVEDFQKRMGAIDPHAADAWAVSMAKLEASVEGIRNAVGSELIKNFTEFNKQVTAFIDNNKGEITGGIVGALREIAQTAKDVILIIKGINNLIPKGTIKKLLPTLPPGTESLNPPKKIFEHVPGALKDLLQGQSESEPSALVPPLAPKGDRKPATFDERFKAIESPEPEKHSDNAPPSWMLGAKAAEYAAWAAQVVLPRAGIAVPAVAEAGLGAVTPGISTAAGLAAIYQTTHEHEPETLGETLRRQRGGKSQRETIKDSFESTRGIDVAALDSNRELGKNTEQISELNRLLEEWLHPVAGSGSTRSLGGGAGYGLGGAGYGAGADVGEGGASSPMGKLPGFGSGSDPLSTRPGSLGSSMDETSNSSSRPGTTIASPAGRTEANEAAATFSGAQGTPAAAVDDAMANLEGREEHRDGALIQRYLTSGDAGMNPADAAWCAATVNAGLKRQGIQGSGSQVATSFLKWGKPAEGAIQKGDVLVQARGHRAGDPGGHVGFATGEERINPRTGQPEVEMFSGNKGDMGRRSWEPRSSVTPRRATDEMLAKAKAGLPTSRVETPTGVSNDALAANRQRFADELANNPRLRDQIAAMGEAEVGSQPNATKGHVEAAMNRASAEGKTLAETINSRYYQPFRDGKYQRAMANLNDAQREKWHGAIDDALKGGNTTDLATGTASGPERAFKGRGFFGQGPGKGMLTTLSGEHFGEEAGTQDWRRNMLKAMREQPAMAARQAPEEPLATIDAQSRYGTAPAPNNLEPGSLLAKAADAQKFEHKVTGDANLNVKVEAPRGTKTKASGEGMFSKVRVNRTMAGEHAPATSAAVSDGGNQEE